MPTTTHDHLAAPAAPSGFRLYWLAETLRLRESQWGPLHDSSETRRVRAQGGTFVQRLLARAHYLGQREGLDALIRQWSGGAKLAMVLLLVAAVIAGAGTALGALGDGTRQVNLLLALATLLGLHAATFLFWCISWILPSGETQASLGELWLWLTRKLARGPQASLVPRAFVGLLSRQNALRPLLGSVSHVLWLCALVAIILVLIALLSARRYTFSWETTLLSPDTFVWLTAVLGWLPSQLGFDIPPASLVRISDGMHALPDSAHAQWSSWLIGCVVCYGILPRSLALAATGFLAHRRIAGLTLDTGLPGYAELRDRLYPPSQPSGIDAPAPEALDVTANGRPATFALTEDRAIVGLELAHDQPWPPLSLPQHVSDLGKVDSREQRHELLDTLHQRTPQKLVIVCDGQQTPDRGTMALVTELSGLAQQARITLLPLRDGCGSEMGDMAVEPLTRHDTGDQRATVWHDRLKQAGIDPAHIELRLGSALEWLDNQKTPDPADGHAP